MKTHYTYAARVPRGSLKQFILKCFSLDERQYASERREQKFSYGVG